MTKKELRNLFADGKINRVLVELRSLTADDIDLYNEVLQISAQFAENDKQRRLNTAKPQDVGMEQNRINSTIVTIIDRLPDKVIKGNSMPIWGKIALWLGFFATVASITGYTLKGLFDKGDTKAWQNNANHEQQTLPENNLVAELSKDNPKKDNKISKKNLIQKVTQTQSSGIEPDRTISDLKTPNTKSQRFHSRIVDENGIGVADAEIYCLNCVVKKVKTDFEGNFTLEGYFEEDALFWQSTITFSKDNEVKT